MRQEQPSRLKTAVFWGIGITLSTLIVLVGLEIMLRVLLLSTFYAETEAPLTHSTTPGLGYNLAPNYFKGDVRTDSNGIRWRPEDTAPPVYKILLIGDSIAFGSGVRYPESFAPLMEAGLRRRLGGPVAVWNAGVPGYNTSQEAVQLDRLGPVVKPDLVVLEFCMNDYMDAPVLTRGGTLDATSTEGPWHFSLMGVFNSSRALVFLKEKFKDLQKARPEWFPVWAHYIHRVSKKPGWERAKLALVQASETARRLKAHFIVVVFPVEQQLRIQDRSALDDVINFAKAHGIDTLDLYYSFREHWREGLYIDYWAQARQFDKLHPSVKGHALVADDIQEKILSDPALALNLQRHGNEGTGIRAVN